MKTHSRFTLILLAMLLFGLLVACGGDTPEEPAAPAEQPPAAVEPAPEVEEEAPEPVAEGLACDEPVKVGLITDRTGALAIYGAHILRGFPLGMEYATGSAGSDMGGYTSYMLENCEFQVFIRDDQSNPETTATMARELIEVEGVDILVGTVSSGATATLQELARENDIVLIVAPAAANDMTGVSFNEYTFRTSRNNYQDAVNICEYLTNNYDTFVQIAPDYSFGYGGAAAFRDACTLFGGEFVADDIFAPADTTEFTPYMEQIGNSGAEAWIVTWAGNGFVPMMQAANELGVMDEMVLASAFVDNVVMPAFFSEAIGATSGILYHYALPDNPINDWLVEETIARFDTPPDLFDADGMNAAILLVEAIKATDGRTDAAALIAAMEGIEFEGPKGTIYIRPEDHVAMQDMYIVTLLNVDDPMFDYYELVETNRPDVPCLLPDNLVDRCGDLPVGSLSGN
jgi:branched-chain amino acid transport system substrate-binding protein